MRQRTSISSKAGTSVMVENLSNTNLRSSSSLEEETNASDVTYHSVQPRTQTAVLPPVMVSSNKRKTCAGI